MSLFSVANEVMNVLVAGGLRRIFSRHPFLSQNTDGSLAEAETVLLLLTLRLLLPPFSARCIAIILFFVGHRFTTEDVFLGSDFR